MANFALIIHCPACGNRLRSVPRMAHATLILQRKCRNLSCQCRWQVKVSPLPKRIGFFMHVVDWLPLP